MVDSNPVFDSYTVVAAPKTFAIESALVADVANCSTPAPGTCNSYNDHPGNTR